MVRGWIHDVEKEELRSSAREDQSPSINLVKLRNKSYYLTIFLWLLSVFETIWNGAL